jgi:heptosyltransferase I
MRILIVRLSALGDIVHAVPVLAALRRAQPDARVDWLVEEAYAPILALATGLHRRVIVRARDSYTLGDTVSFGGIFGFGRAAAFLRAQRYDAVLDLQGLIKSAVWARAAGGKILWCGPPPPSHAARLVSIAPICASRRRRCSTPRPWRRRRRRT